MKSRFSFAKWILAFAFTLSAAIAVLLPSSSLGARGTPASMVAPAPQTTPFQGTYDPHVYPCATQRHHFTLGPGQARIVLQVNAQVPTNDLTVSLLYGSDPNPELITTEDTLTCCEALTYQPSGGVPPGEYQVQICQTPNTNGVPQNAPFDYVGTFTTDDTAASPPASPTPTPNSTPTATPTPGNNGPRYYNYAPGPAVGENSGEPSIGYNPATKHAMYLAGLQTLRVTLPENFLPLGVTPEAAPARWEDVSSIVTRTRSVDPILFTDLRSPNRRRRSISGIAVKSEQSTQQG